MSVTEETKAQVGEAAGATVGDGATTSAPQTEKPARRRTTRAKKAAEGEAAEPKAEGATTAKSSPRAAKAVKAAAEQAATSDSAEGAAAKPERKATRTRKATKAEVEGASVADAPTSAASATAAAPVEAAAPKPRRGRPRKSVALAVEDGANATPAAGEPPAASGASNQATGDAASTAAPAAPVEAAEPKPRRGRPRKSVVPAAGSEPAPEAASAVGEAPAASAAPAEERPHRTPRTRSDRGDGNGRDRDNSRDRDNAHGGSRDRNAADERNDRRNGDSRNNNNNRNRNDRDNDRRNRRQRDNRQNREVAPSLTKEELAELKVADLRAKAAELGIDGAGVKKADLIDMVYDAAAKAEGFLEVSGVLDILADGYGFLRAAGYLPGEGDSYVGTSTIRRNGLRKGDFVVGQTRPARANEKFAAIQKVISVNGVPAEEVGARPHFKDLTPVFPDDRLLMEHGKNTITARVIDLAAPIGKGQRGLIVSPPKAGKTTVLKDIAASITANNPEVHLMYLGIDERPEEATDMERSIRGEVVSSTFDMPCENHIAVAELVIERAKRLVEMGKDVVILLDSITRLARAYNLAQPASGRILSGGVDSTALYPPKRFLGAARNIEGGGSLTILASALIDTGSKMDEVIFEEFKGTGNMELKLDRNLADRRIFPAIDPVTSGTRKEELLLDPQEAPLIWAVRRILSNTNSTERAMDMLIKSLKQTETNQEFLIRTAKKAQTSHGKSDENFEF